MEMSINEHLTEIDINELVLQVGIPFNYITDDEISQCIQNKIFLETQCIYNGNMFYYNTKTYHLLRIATIINEIQNNRYNYNYELPIYDDSNNAATHEWDTDGNGEHQIRAFYYCKKNIFMLICRT